MTRPHRGTDHWIIHRDADGRRRVAPDRETLTERLIREAQEAGRFDDLPGQGRPLVLDDDTDAGEMALANLVLRNAGAAPPWIETDKEVRASRAALEALIDRAARTPNGPAARFERELEALADAHDAAAVRLESQAPTARQQRSRVDRGAFRARLAAALGATRPGA